MFFRRKKTTQIFQIELAFLHHSLETRQILIYNNGRSTLKDIQIRLKNDQGKSANFTLKAIAARSNEMIDFSLQAEPNENQLSGELVEVEIEINNEIIKFKPKPVGKFIEG